MSKRNRTVWLALGGLAALTMAPRGAMAQGAGASAPQPAGSQPAAALLPAAVPAATSGGTPVTLHLRDTPLRAALQMLFEGSGLQHAVEPGVPNYPITLEIRDVPFNTALRTLLRLAPGVTYSKDGEIYMVGLRRPAPELPANNAEPPLPAETAGQAGEGHWERIVLNYLHPAVLAYVMNGVLIPTEEQILSGLGGPGGGGAGGIYGGSGGLGATGTGSLGYGIPGYGNQGSLVPGNGINGVATPGSFPGIGQGAGTGVLFDSQRNSVIFGPQPRRF